MSIIVANGAGVIGSCIVITLKNKEINDIVIVHSIRQTEKWRNFRIKGLMNM